MYDGKRMVLIDWEYSSMGDPFFDIADVLEESRLSGDAACSFAEVCLGHSFGDYEAARIHVSQLLCCIYWAAWGAAQIARGKNAQACARYGKEKTVRGLSIVRDPSLEESLMRLESQSFR